MGLTKANGMPLFEDVHETVRRVEIFGNELVAFHVSGVSVVVLHNWQHPAVVVSKKQLLVDELCLKSFAQRHPLFISEVMVGDCMVWIVLGSPRMLWGIGPSSVPITNPARWQFMVFRESGDIPSLDRRGLKPFENFAHDLLSPLGGAIIFGAASRRHEQYVQVEFSPRITSVSFLRA
jgi:hypothetical protein